MTRYRVLAFLRGGRTRRTVVSARSHDEAWGLAFDFARDLGAHEFLVEAA